MMEEPAVCMPFGFGYRGAETTITWDGDAYACIPFRVERGGASIVEEHSAHWSIEEYPTGLELMVRTDHPLAARLRPIVAPDEAWQLLFLVESADPEPSALSSRSWAYEEAVRLCTSRDPAPICVFLGGILRADPTLSFGEIRVVQALSRVMLGELAGALGVTPEALRETVAGRIGGGARHLLG